MIVLICTKTFGTAQIPDKIIFEGKTYRLHSNPLEIYFEKHSDQRPQGGIMSTALWRGYVATYTIENDELIVKDIEIQISEEVNGKYTYSWKSVIDEVFANMEDRKVTWYSGILILPHGRIKNYVHMGYGSIYSKYILLEVEQGNLKEHRKYKGREFVKFKDRQFEVYKQSDEYKETVAELLEDQNNSEEFIEGFLRVYVINYTTKFLDE